jgi:hypothetical protein
LGQRRRWVNQKGIYTFGKGLGPTVWLEAFLKEEEANEAG